MGFAALASYLFYKQNFAGFGISKNNGFQPRPIKPFGRQVLVAYFDYYKKLSPENQRRFEGRVQAFKDSNQFIPKGFTHVSDEMKYLISAAAIQLTFGFHHLNFEHFQKILVYREKYLSPFTKKYHQGEVNPRGAIVLTWDNFKKGYHHPTDGRNVALHEMAHALKLENKIYNGEYDFIDGKSLQQFDKLARLEMQKIKPENEPFFRKYAAVNEHEFFAVAVENFFERPKAFLEHHSALYHSLAELLRQDPLRLEIK